MLSMRKPVLQIPVRDIDDKIYQYSRHNQPSPPKKPFEMRNSKIETRLRNSRKNAKESRFTGNIALLVEPCDRTAEVRGSTPLISTTLIIEVYLQAIPVLGRLGRPGRHFAMQSAMSTTKPVCQFNILPASRIEINTCLYYV